MFNDICVQLDNGTKSAPNFANVIYTRSCSTAICVQLNNETVYQCSTTPRNFDRLFRAIKRKQF